MEEKKPFEENTGTEAVEKSTKTGGFCSPGVVMVWYTVRARFKGPAPLHGRAFRESHRWA